MNINFGRHVLLAALLAVAGSQNAYAENPKTTSALTEDERDFLEEATADNLEMQAMAKMGTTKGSHSKVKEFSKEITTAQTALMTQIKALATKKAATIPTAMEKDDRLKLEAIEKLSGLTFDKRFMKEVADEHEDMIENYEEAIREVKDADIKSFAEKSLPGLRDHLAKAKAIVSELEGSASK